MKTFVFCSDYVRGSGAALAQPESARTQCRSYANNANAEPRSFRWRHRGQG